MEMANKTGYMDKERAGSEKRHKEYLEWLKKAQAESKVRRKAFVASHREYAKTIGKEKKDYGGHMKKYEQLRDKRGLALSKKTVG